MITIFTSVYNRAHLIGNLYQSLLGQTDHGFEWLVVDDGSEDSIAEVIHSWIREGEAPFAIRFYQQENGGKHRAINRGVRLARGDAFFIVDSDDTLAGNAVEMIHKWWEGIGTDDAYAGVAGLRGNKEGEPIGGWLPGSYIDAGGKPVAYIDASNIERGRYGLVGDKAEIYRTLVLRRNPFPEIEGENFLTEATVWDKIAYSGQKLRWFGQVIYLCEYLAGGLTSRGWEIFAENPIGWGYYIQQKCRFYSLDDAERMALYLEYYILTKDRLPESEMMDNLGIGEREFRKVMETLRGCIERTVYYIGRNIAVYGAGMRGRKVLRLYQDTEINILYVLDRKKADVPWTQIDLDGKYPKADAIIVTPRNGQSEIMEFLSGKTGNRLVGYNEWKACIGIGQDF